MTLLIIDFLVQTVTTIIIYGAFTVIIAFTLWMIVDAAKQDRFWWVVVIWGVPGIGPAVYYLTEKKHEYAKVPSHHVHESETEAQHETSPKEHHHHRKGGASLETLAVEDNKSEVVEDKHFIVQKEGKTSTDKE